jgi:hypothetical protein
LIFIELYLGKTVSLQEAGRFRLVSAFAGLRRDKTARPRSGSRFAHDGMATPFDP